jgi:hypothetical protein
LIAWSSSVPSTIAGASAGSSLRKR